MNKIFKTKYDVTTGQTKAVSELASNRQVASSSGEKPKCDVFFGGNLGAFKVLPLALLMLGLLSSVAYGDNDNVYHWDQGEGSYIAPYKDGVHEGKNKESVLITKKENTAGLEVNKARKNNASFKHTVAVGSRTVVGGHGATSIGYKAIAGSNVNKSNVDDYNQEMTAIGYRVFANGDSSTAIGNEATAWGDNSIAIGSDNAKGDGKDNRAERALSYDVWRLVHDKRKDFLYTADYATTKEEINDYQNYLSFKNGDQESKNRLKKSHTWARGHNAISIGSRSIAYGNDSTAMGTLALAIGNYSTSLGAFSMAFGEKSIAIGNETYVYKSGSVGVGNGVQAISDGSIVYGLESYAGGLGSIAIGTRALSNVETSDNFKEKTKESVFGVTAIYDDVSTVGKLDELDTAKPNDYFKPKVVGQEGSGEEKANSNTKTGGLAIGYYALAYGENALALGRQVYAKGERSIAIGPYAYAKAEKTAALGYGSKAIGEQSMALGSLSRAEGNNSIAIGINSAVKNESNSDKRNGLNTLAIGNETEATMDNSVALGYKSHTKYFYQDTNKNTATLTGKDAISLEPYVPEGSSYNLRTDKSAGIVSVGWTKDGNKLGLRRIIGVAPGALDSDVATIGQLKALAYVKKDGTPYKDLGHIDANNVFVGPKGEDEKTRTEMKASKEYSLGDMGKKIKFAHILDGEIKSGSDQAVTGNQLYSVKDVLGVELNQNTTLKRPSFGAVNYVNGGKRVTETFKDALTDTINAINSGYKFSDGDSTNIAKNTPFYLGSTLEIKAGDIQTTHKSTNLKTKLTLEDTNSKAVFTIGLSDTPTFKKVMLDNENAPTDNKELVNKKYVDDKFQNVATSFNVAGDSGDFKVTNRLDIKGDTNISTKASTNEVKISLQEALTGIASVMGKNGGTKIEFTNDGLTLNSKKITGLQDGNNDTDAVTFKQLNDSKLHFLSVHDEGKNKGNYNNDGAKAANSVAIGVDVEAQTGADSAVLVGHSLSTNVKNSVVVGSNINIEQEEKDRKFRKDAVVAIGSGLKLKNAKSSIVIGAVDERSKADNSPTNDEWRTVIEDATWSVVLGNKTKIKNGDDVLALGNNIIAKGTVQGKISGLVILGNRAKATDAKNSVVIGTSAESKAESAVVLGHEAKVESAAGDSIALGKGSKATKKEIAPSEAKSSKDVKFAWTAGIGGDKSVVSIGDSDKERQIKHVAAGVVTSASTDAINGSQLYAVADEFSKLAVDVLGAEKADNDKTGFKKSTFTAVNYQGSKNKSPQTFRDAINESIAAINKGLKFAGNEGTAFTSQLGVTVNIKGDGTDLSSKAENNAIIFALHKADKVEANNDKVVTSKAVHTEISKVTQELNNAEISYKANGTSEQKVKLTDGFNFTNSDNITAEVKDKGVVKFKLNDTLQNITSISGKADNGTAPQIDFANQEGLKISSQGVEATFKTGGLHLNDKQLKGVNSGLGLPANGGNSTEITNKVLAGTPDNDSNAVNVKDLSTVAKAIVDKGLTFKGDSGVDIARKLGETLTIKGEKDYTETVTNGAEMTVKLTQGVKDKLGVITVEGDKLAIGKDSTLEEKGTAFNGADINVGIKNSLKFNWTGGVSADDTEQNKKSVISVGSDDKERIITHVAAGKVSNDSTDAINGSQLAEVIRVFGNLGTDILGGEVDPVTKTFKASTFDKLKDESGTDTAVKAQTTFKGAIDSLIATVNKGLIFAGNTGEFTRQIGAKITIEGENGDITTTANIGNITLKLNKAYKVLESDEKVVTSKAVAEELKKYTSTATLDKNFLKVDGSNIGGNQSKFGENVGISKINLENGKKSTTELVQAKAVIDYLKGMGTGSVKISDNPETKAEGEGSIAVGDKAIAQNAGAVAIGQNAGAKNAGAISIGKDSDVTSIDGVALGRKNVVGGQSSIAIGETNTVSGVQSYVIGSDNDIKGREVVAIGSNITADEKIHDAVILGKGSTGEAKTVSVGSTDTKRRIIFVDTPTGEYDAANKKYVDERGLKFKGNEENQTELVNLDKLLTIDSSEANKYDKGKKEKDIKTKVEKEGDGAKLTLTLNKADEVSEHDERAVSSKAVHSALQAAKKKKKY
ncbi:hypothetical protein CFY87_02775 [Actinobacillus seminis]|uniref:Autotransporter adhesin n=1 Tax=Actinobacillus seminis TaxID=722 RepID=A0ABX4FNU1_9PAST|nr:ESPR-type extended signal peptide-containing protein [Actinobacillus seminis]OZN25541.1 hypothetical protein CFY87_02775 [Actinobacillus seminis]